MQAFNGTKLYIGIHIFIIGKLELLLFVLFSFYSWIYNLYENIRSQKEAGQFWKSLPKTTRYQDLVWNYEIKIVLYCYMIRQINQWNRLKRVEKTHMHIDFWFTMKVDIMEWCGKGDDLFNELVGSWISVPFSCPRSC